MPTEDPDDPAARRTRNIKLVLMGVAGAALLYSCTPGVTSSFVRWPGFGFFGNPFYRPGLPPVCTPGTPPGMECVTDGRSSSGGGGRGGSGSNNSGGGQTTSERGGFGSSGAAHGGGGGE